MFEPLGFAAAERVTDRFERRHVRALIRGVGYDEHDVDDRLGAQPWHRGRPRVVHFEREVTERRPDPDALGLEDLRPLARVGHQANPHRAVTVAGRYPSWRGISRRGLVIAVSL